MSISHAINSDTLYVKKMRFSDSTINIEDCYLKKLLTTSYSEKIIDDVIFRTNYVTQKELSN